MHEDIDFQVVIASYNRKENIVRLVNAIKLCNPRPQSIIVVDATVDENEELKLISDVYYFHQLRHKNQPYQRLVGALAAESEYLIFMDDDLEILDNNIFGRLLNLLITEGTVAVTAAIENENYEKQEAFASSVLGQTILFLTGLPFVRTGKMTLVGHTGKLKEHKIARTQYLHGPIMGFRRSVFLKLPDTLMLNLFDLHLAIPEDKILSIRASRHGNLLYYPEQVVKHPKIESTYFKNIEDYTARVHFSRYLINMELAHTRGRLIEFIYSFQYSYYSFWRKLISLIRSFFEPKIYYRKFKGFLMADQWVRKYKRSEIPMHYTIVEDATCDAGRIS